MTTLTFYFVIPIPENTGTTSEQMSFNCEAVNTPSGNENLTALCGPGSYAYYNANSSCSSLYTITSGGGIDHCCCPNGTSLKAESGNTQICTSSKYTNSVCSNYTLLCGNTSSNQYQVSGSCGYGSSTTCTLKFTCFTPTTSNYISDPKPIANPTWMKFYYSNGATTNTSTFLQPCPSPAYALFNVQYALSDFTTASQIESAINTFISNTVISNLKTAQYNSTTLAATNIASIIAILNQFCSTSSTNLTTTPCNQYCGFTTGNLQASITNTTNNCSPAYQSYCNNLDTVGSSECMTYYTNQNQDDNYNYSTLLTSQCATSSLYVDPINSLSPYTYADGVPSICYCYPPQNILSQYYKAVDAALGLSGLPPGTSSLAVCNYAPCTSHSAPWAIASASAPACPSSNLQVCLNEINATGSEINVDSMSNSCLQSITNNTTTNNNNTPVSSVSPASSVSPVSSPSRTTSVSPTSSASSWKKWLLVSFCILLLLVGGGFAIYYFLSDHHLK